MERRSSIAFVVLELNGKAVLNSAHDDWRLMTAVNPDSDRALLIKLKQGQNVIRLTNMNSRGITT